MEKYSPKQLKKENKRRLKLMSEIQFSHEFHQWSTAEHCRMVHRAAKMFTRAAIRLDPLDIGGCCASHHLRTAAMTHDWGKVETFNPNGGEAGEKWFPNHEKKSAEILEQMGVHPFVIGLVREHGNIRKSKEMTPQMAMEILYRIYEDLPPETVLHYFITLLECDALGFSPRGRLLSRVQSFAFCAKTLAIITQPDRGGVLLSPECHENVKYTRHWLAERGFVALSLVSYSMK
jgi:putative nucleotidyltransferase with HDIG domain